VSKEPKGSAIVLVLVVPLVLENADTGWDVEDDNENDDEDETSVHGEPRRHFSCAHWDQEPPPLSRPSATLSPAAGGGEGRERGPFMEREPRPPERSLPALAKSIA